MHDSKHLSPIRCLFPSFFFSSHRTKVSFSSFHTLSYDPFIVSSYKKAFVSMNGKKRIDRYISYGYPFRSIFGEQWLGLIHHTLACWSTFVGMWRGKIRWILQSIHCTFAPGARRPWFSSWKEPTRSVPWSHVHQFLETWWYLRTGRRWSRGLFGCPRHTSWWIGM